MADCGICLDVLRNPVCVPCGHVHCERCLKAHISSGTDALKSTCPTCRKPFHIATPDFAFVPQKYHDFILPCVRRVFVDIPSVAVIIRDREILAQRLEAVTKENEHMRQRVASYKNLLETAHSEKRNIVQQEAEARRETLDLRKKYDSLKKKYWRTQSRDDEYDTTPSQGLSHRSSQIFDASREILPKEEEHPVSLEDLSPNPPRPKRALPKSCLNGPRRKGGPTSQHVKRQRTHRHSDVGCSSQLLAVVKCEDEEYESE